MPELLPLNARALKARGAAAALLGATAVLLLAAPAPLEAQLKDALSLPDLSTLRQDYRTQATRQLEQRAQVPLDAPVNPAEYIVGPGDVLALNIWGSSPVEHQLTVTPEGTLLIPTVGAADVRDLSLAQAKEKVIAMTSRRLKNAEISLTLLTPRKVTVTIAGYVLNEGRKEVNAVQRVDNLIDISNEIPAGRMSLEEYAGALAKLRNDASERNIVLRGRKGDTRRVDLAKYRATGLGRYDPYLREGDYVYVPGRSDLDNAIAVFGGTLRKANFEYVRGDSLSGLVAMALGMEEGRSLEHAFLTRLSVNGARMDTVSVDLPGILSGSAPDVALQPGDRLVVTAPADLRRNYRVVIEGEVVSPGTYPIALNTTRVSDVIRTAGGVTHNANLRAATIRRLHAAPEARNDRLPLEELESRRTTLASEDTAYYGLETALRINSETVSVDLYKLLVEHDTTQDAVLSSYDRIEIPPITHTVYVFGQVLRPGHVQFVAGKGYGYYIDQALGYTEEARSGDVAIIKGATRTWLKPGETAVEDGDYIWVPKEVHYPFAHYMTIYAQIASIIGVAATVALLIKSYK